MFAKLLERRSNTYGSLAQSFCRKHMLSKTDKLKWILAVQTDNLFFLQKTFTKFSLTIWAHVPVCPSYRSCLSDSSLVNWHCVSPVCPTCLPAPPWSVITQLWPVSLVQSPRPGWQVSPVSCLTDTLWSHVQAMWTTA